ncbi:MAG: ferritin-like domain-containing protein [Acidimicrobiales bacterium]
MTLPDDAACRAGWRYPAPRETRREFISRAPRLARAGAVAAGAATLGGSLEACSTHKPAAVPRPAKHLLSGRLRTVAMLTSLENLLIFSYTSALTAIRQDRLGIVAPAVTAAARVCLSHHQAHAAAWNAVLGKAGKAPVEGGDPALEPGIRHSLASAKDQAALLLVLLSLEGVTAASYQVALADMTAPTDMATAASIQPVELQHAAIWLFLTGHYPVPDPFSQVYGARPATDYSGEG